MLDKNQKDQMSLSKEIELYQCLISDTLSLVYMPIVELSTDLCIGAETLLRYKNKKGEWVGPKKYINTLKELPIGNLLLAWILKKSKPLLNLTEFTLSVNCPGELLGTGIIGSALYQNNLIEYASKIIVEITEYGTVNPSARGSLQFYTETIPELRFAFDDTPRELDKTREDLLCYIDIIKFSHPRAIYKDEKHNECAPVKYICEFIETKEDRDRALAKDIDYGQGWYYSPGLCQKEFIEYYSDHGKKTTGKTN